MDWDGALEAVAARLTVTQGRLTIDDAKARVLGGWMRLRLNTFVDLQGPRRAFVFGTLNCPIELRAGEIHLADNLTVSAPEFTLVINGYRTLDGALDYEVHSDLVHRLLFSEVINLAEEIPMLGTVLRHINPFQRIHQHIELSATVQGNIFRRNTAGQSDVHVDVYFVQ